LSPTEDVAPPTLAQFQEGEMVFSPDRVTLCGASICSGRRSVRQRKVLDLLRLKNADGQFHAYSSKSLAEKVGLKDSGSVPGLIRDLRAQISKRLREKVSIDCGPEDVILSGDQGYRFSEKLSVQDAENFHGAGLHGHEPGGAAKYDADRDADRDVDDADHDRARDADNQDHDANREPGRDADDSPLTEVDDAVIARRKWILKELGKGQKLQ